MAVLVLLVSVSLQRLVVWGFTCFQCLHATLGAVMVPLSVSHEAGGWVRRPAPVRWRHGGAPVEGGTSFRAHIPTLLSIPIPAV